LRACAQGDHRVSRKQRGGRELPVIDLNTSSYLGAFAGCGLVSIVIDAGAVHVLLPSSARKALARCARLAAKLATSVPLATAGMAFGAGIASNALHDGLIAGGLQSRLVLANEICEDYVLHAARANPIVTGDTVIAAVPMQELAHDDWLMRQLPPIDLLEAGIPCSGASKAGVSKRRLPKMEDHPTVGHLIGSLIQAIGLLQPAIVVVENVESYRDTGSAAILRGWLLDAGYAVAETVLNANDFGSLESRVRWFLVAYPPQLSLNLTSLAKPGTTTPPAGMLGDHLETIDPSDERYREVNYLKAKEQRDAAHGSGFGMQWLTPTARRVPVLRKGYHKGGSTDPRVLHPSDPQRSRLLTALEHARIKGIAPQLVAGLSETVAHQVCGQSVDVRPVRALGTLIAAALLGCFGGQQKSNTSWEPVTAQAQPARHSMLDVVG
jgi:DNA (cytosine-5)-methyltransferase 1